MVAEVSSKEKAFRLGNADFQADSASRPSVNAQQVEAKDRPQPSKAAAAVYVAAATSALAAAEANLTASLIKELLAEARDFQQQQVVERPAQLLLEDLLGVS